jgi:hypothetical protein
MSQQLSAVNGTTRPSSVLPSKEQPWSNAAQEISSCQSQRFCSSTDINIYSEDVTWVSGNALQCRLVPAEETRGMFVSQRLPTMLLSG